jgi:NADH-quinone oxidoreductase subunit E
MPSQAPTPRGPAGQGLGEGVDLTFLQTTLARHPARPDQLIPLLRAVQELYGYLPPAALGAVADYLRVPRAKVFGVATFYAQFRCFPLGRHLVRVCRGSGCYVCGSARVQEAVEAELGVEDGETTPDGMFTLQTVTCLGACAWAPVVVVDGIYYGPMTPSNVRALLRRLKKEAER